jgi:hypothetical protein
MTSDTLSELRRRVADLEREAARAVLRDWVTPGVGGPVAGGLTEDDLRRSCNEAVAINLTGREVQPGHVMWCDSDATALDLTQLYPHEESDQATLKESHVIDGATSSVTLDAPLGDDDLLILFTAGSSSGFHNDLLADWASTPFENCHLKDSFPNVVGFNIQFNWGDAFTDRSVIPFNVPGTPAPQSRRVVVVLSGVARKASELHETYEDEDDVHSLIVNGLQQYLYLAHDDEAADDSNVMTREPSALNETTALAGNSSIDTSAWPSLSDAHEFPVGTQFLIFHHFYHENLFSTAVARLDTHIADLPDTDLLERDENGANVTTARRESVYAIHMTEPLTDAGPAPLAAWLANYADWDASSGTNSQSRDVLVVYALPPAVTTPASFPAIPCDPLVATEYLRAVPLTANTGSAKAIARALLAKNRRRDPVIVKSSAIAYGASGTVLRRGGYAKFWAYRRNLTDRYVGPVPENAERIDIYDSPLSGEVGKLGKFYRSAAAKRAVKVANADAGIDDIDPRVECFTGRADLLYSATSGPIEVLQWGRDETREPGALTVTITTRKTSQSGEVISGRWNNWTLSTGSDVDLTEPNNLWIRRPDTEILLDLQTFLLIDLTTDAAGESRPVYGVTGQAYQTVTSTSGLYFGSLIRNRWLYIAPVYAEWTGDTIAIDDPQTDTFAFTDDALAPVYADFAPFIYCDPETGEFGEVGVDVNYADWPEEWPTPPSQVPEGTDIVDVPAGFDPLLGRVPGEVEAYEEDDQRLGLQLCFGYIHGWPSRGDGGCC